MSKDDGFELSASQAHELGLALRRKENTGWDRKLFHTLTQGDLLQQVRQVLLGSARIVESGLLDCLGSFMLPGFRGKVSLTHLTQPSNEPGKGTVAIKPFKGRLAKLLLPADTKETSIERPEQQIFCFQLGATEKYALMECKLVEIFGHVSHLAFTLPEVFAVIEWDSHQEVRLLDVVGKNNIFLVHVSSVGYLWVYVTFDGSHWILDATEAFLLSDMPIHIYAQERFFAKKHYLKT